MSETPKNPRPADPHEARKSMLEEIGIVQAESGAGGETPSSRGEVRARMHGSVQEAFDRFELSLPPWGPPENSSEDRTQRERKSPPIVPLKLS